MSNNTDLFGIEPLNIGLSGVLPVSQLPIVPKDKGGFGQDVSVGLTDGQVAIVSGGQITIGPLPASQSRVQLAMLSAPFFNACVWYTGQYIALDSANKSYSTGFWNNIAGYSPAVTETLSKITVQLDPNVSSFSANGNVSIWVQPLGGSEYDTGIFIPVTVGNNFFQNLVDTVTLNAGDQIKFSLDVAASAQWISIYAHRQ